VETDAEIEGFEELDFGTEIDELGRLELGVGTETEIDE
jgi:hypothetical protein